MNTAADRSLTEVDTPVQMLAIDLIERSPYQPRDRFDPKQLDLLADNLKVNGLIQPIIVRRLGARFELVVGERRWRAAQRAGWHEIPAIVRELTDAQSAEAALAENELRVNVNPIATARAVTRLIETFGHTQDDVAAILGVDRTSVCNLLRLLTLDTHVQELIGEGEQHISVGHAKILAGIAKPQQRALAQRVIQEHLSVRQLERIVKAVNETAAHARPGKDPNVAQLELHLTDHLGQKVRIEWSDQGGEVRIQFSSTEELDGFLQRIGYVAR